MRIFLSYARDNRPLVDALATDLKDMDYEAFFDEQLAGGQVWWDELLNRIEGCDVFLPVLSAEYLDSHPCALEAEYAHALNKPFLPVALDAVSPALFSSYVAEAQWVKYNGSDRNSVIELVRAFRNVRPAPPLPDAMPTRPAVPISYLTAYRELIDSPDDLTRAQQNMLLSDLRARLDTPDGPVVRSLLEKFARRHDLVVSVADELSRLLAREPATVDTSPPPTPPPADPREPVGAGASAHGAPRNHRARWIAIAAIVVVIGLAIPIYLFTRSSGKSSAAGNAGGMGMGGTRATGKYPNAAEAALLEHIPPSSEQCMRYTGNDDVGNSTAQLECTDIHGFKSSTRYLSFDNAMDMDDHYNHYSNEFNPAPGNCLTAIGSAWENAHAQTLPQTSVKGDVPSASAGPGHLMCTQNSDGTLGLVWTNERLNILAVSTGPIVTGEKSRDTHNAQDFFQWWSKQLGPCVETCASGA